MNSNINKAELKSAIQELMADEFETKFKSLIAKTLMESFRIGLDKTKTSASYNDFLQFNLSEIKKGNFEFDNANEIFVLQIAFLRNYHKHLLDISESSAKTDEAVKNQDYYRKKYAIKKEDISKIQDLWLDDKTELNQLLQMLNQ